MVRKCRKAKGIVGSSSTYMQLRSRRIFYIGGDEKNTSSVFDDEVSPSSCCASNNEGFIIDMEEERDGDTETSAYQRSTKRKLFENRREKESSISMENSSENAAEFDSAAIQKPCCSGRRISLTTEEKPTEVEIEDFFVEAEKQLNDKFKKKYNFDFEKEKPLEGRYEWVKII